MDTKRVLRWTWLLVVAAVVYAGAILAMRWNERRVWEENARQRQAAADREVVERYGDGALKVLMFYANPPQVNAGGKTLLCYGVANAASVSINPGVESISPSLSRCVEIRPTTDTTYTLVATGRSGEQASQSLQVRVR